MTSTQMTQTENNPLLDFTDLPRYADIKPQHIEPAIQLLLKQANIALEKAISNATAATWEDLSCTLDVATERLGRAWSALSHIKAVNDTPEIRQAYSALLPEITEFWTKLGQNEALYAKYQKIRNHPQTYSLLTSEQKRALDLTLQGFMLSGVALQGGKKAKFAQIQELLAQTSQRFSENLLDATDSWEFYVDQNRLTGVPPDIMSELRHQAQELQNEGYRISLQPPIYIALMQYAQDRPLREQLYKAYVTRASEKGPSSLDNTPLIEKILQLRQTEAQLLGYKNYAEVSLEPKMAKDAQQVIAFLENLAEKARPYALKDLEELQTFARNELKMDTLNAWDIAYVSEKLKEERYAFSDQEVKAYFTQPKVIAGLFHLAEKLFDISITEEQNAQIWNPLVKLYCIKRHGQKIGQFYTDLTARPGKRAGAWMDDVRARWLRPDTHQMQLPVAQLVCNFASGVNGNPPLLTHDDVQTVFHEFGHGLHHLLTQVDEKDVSGISGVEWDAVELPSQFMENFCWEWDVLQELSEHVETKKQLPYELYEKMLAAKNFQSGLFTLRQIEFALFDIRLHADFIPDKQTVQQLLDQIRQEIAVVIPPEYNRFQNSFSHIFAGGYAAGYYSYKWAEVLAADAYAAFEEAAQHNNGQIISPEVSQHFLKEILEMGGARPALESFKAFRGREPQIEALLRQQGMAQ